MRAASDESEIDQDRLIAIVAHELRYPLVPIGNAAALLRHDPPDPATIRRVADVIEHQANGMSRLIGDLVDMSQMQRGALGLQRIRAPLSELMARAAESAALVALERGHTLAVSVAREPIYLEMDVLRLDQALRHIVASVAPYGGGNGHIDVLALRSGAQVVIRVSQTGLELGIPHAEQGLGFGLYLARYLIEMHGGTVMAAKLASGQGRAYVIRLPGEPARRTATGDESEADDPSPA